MPLIIPIKHECKISISVVLAVVIGVSIYHNLSWYEKSLIIISVELLGDQSMRQYWNVTFLGIFRHFVWNLLFCVGLIVTQEIINISIGGQIWFFCPKNSPHSAGGESTGCWYENAGWACVGNAGNVFPAGLAIPTCITARASRILGACTARNFTYLVRSPWYIRSHFHGSNTILIAVPANRIEKASSNWLMGKRWVMTLWTSTWPWEMRRSLSRHVWKIRRPWIVFNVSDLNTETKYTKLNLN